MLNKIHILLDGLRNLIFASAVILFDAIDVRKEYNSIAICRKKGEDTTGWNDG